MIVSFRQANLVHTPYKIFSYGGGVQSTAALVLAAQGKIDYDVFTFCNVGENAENPKTLDYVRDVAIPYAQANNIPFVVLRKLDRNKNPHDLYDFALKQRKSIVIPVWVKTVSKKGKEGTAPGRRNCTAHFKIKLVEKYARNHHRGTVIVGLGISTDEFHRAKSLPPQKIGAKLHKINEYPLLNLRLSRVDCVEIIKSAGLPVPPKSSCFFCPFHSPEEWVKIYDETPDLFLRSVALEAGLNDKRAALGKDQVSLHQNGELLHDAIKMPLPAHDDANCDGYCHT